MHRILGVILLGAGTLAVAMAGGLAPAPEIDASTSMAAMTLLAGAVFIIRGRRKK